MPPTYNIVAHGDGFKIQPADLDTSDHPWEAFDNRETEVSARYIVRLCQQLGGWHPFTEAQIQEFYRTNGGYHYGFRFNRLVEPGQVYVGGPYNRRVELRGGGWIVEKDGKFHVTDDFILRYHKASPAKVERKA